MSKVEIPCRNENLVLEEGGRFPSYTDDKLEEECGLRLIERKYKYGNSIFDINAGAVSLYSYKTDNGKEVSIVVSGNLVDERVVAIDENPQKAVARGLMTELDDAVKNNDINKIYDIVAAYSKILEKI